MTYRNHEGGEPGPKREGRDLSWEEDAPEGSDGPLLEPGKPVDAGPRHPRAPVPKTRIPGPYPLPPRERRHGLVIVNTGNGKGKTTASLGLVLRAVGRGMEVAVLQFIKSGERERGEHVGARKLGVEVESMGAGFTWLSESIEQDRELARRCWSRCAEVLHSGQYDLVVFDELTYALAYGWLSHAEVFRVLEQRPQGVHVVITGRKATDELVDFADLVTEMNEVKHPYRTHGVAAQAGIEL